MRVFKLEKMFNNQRFIQKLLMGVELPDDKPDLVPFHALGLVSELGELLQADKRWKDTSKGYHDNSTKSKEEVIAEIADLWLFLMNLTLVCGMDHNKLFDAVEQKQQEVLKRNGFTEEEL